MHGLLHRVETFHLIEFHLIEVSTYRGAAKISQESIVYAQVELCDCPLKSTPRDVIGSFLFGLLFPSVENIKFCSPLETALLCLGLFFLLLIFGEIRS